MKKFHLFIALLLFSSQILLPLNSFADSTDSSKNTYDSTNSNGPSSESIESPLKNPLLSKQSPAYSSTDEPLNSWLPDKGLQNQVAMNLGIPAEFITKDLLAEKDIQLNIYYSNIPQQGSVSDMLIADLTGIEYAKSYSIMFASYSDVTTENLNDLLKNHFSNLINFIFYSSTGYTQIDLYEVFKDYPNFLNGNVDVGNLSINGRILMASESPLIIPKKSYSSGGKLSIPLKAIGFWSNNQYSLFSNETMSIFNDLIIKDGNNILAIYHYDSFDSATQSFIYTFDEVNSQPFENLAGKNLFYSLPDPEYYYATQNSQSIPSMSIHSMNYDYSLSVSLMQSNETFLFPSVQFTTNYSSVSINYFDEQGNKLADTITKSGNIGDTYISEQLTINGYTFKQVLGHPSGTFSAEEQTVTYIYTKNPTVSTDITIRYKDIDGNAIAPDNVKSGNIGDPYSSEQLTIDGYTFKQVTGNPTGTFTDTAQSVTYVYTKNPVVGANVTIHYQDTEGNTIALDILKSGNIGDLYSSEQLILDGYTFKEVTGNPTGTFTDTAQSVTYVYTKNKITSPLEPTNPSESHVKPSGEVTSYGSDSSSSELPQTGETNSSILIATGFMILLVSSAYVLTSKRKQK